MPATKEQLARFLTRHTEPGLIVLPNAWDPGSAALMVEAGFDAIATTSAGIAYAQGVPDKGVLGRDKMIEQAARIAASVDVPVTADLEDGYGPRPADVAATVRAAIDAGLAGCNIEDSGVEGNPGMLDVERACERIQAAREEIARTGRPFLLNARTDPFLTRHGSNTLEENFVDAVRRANAYAVAGADGVFVPGPSDPETIARLVAAIHAPVNMLGARAGSANVLTVAEFARLGVRRITIGGSLALSALGLVRQALVDLAAGGVFRFGSGAPTNAEMDAIMARHRRNHRTPDA